MEFSYRNDYRKILLPYLRTLPNENWFQKSEAYPNNLAWIISHIALSEDYWINEIAFKQQSILTIDENSQPMEIIKAYEKIRLHTDAILNRLDNDQLTQLIDVPLFSDGWTPPSIPTIRWVFQHVYSHESYHIGQIAVIAHLNGFQKPLF